MKILKLFLSTTLLAAVHVKGESMDELLNTYETKSDLSQKTKIANAGNVRIFERQELDTMQVRTLKDVINALPLLNYAESVFGFPDPNYTGGQHPFDGSLIRIYIDDQEVSSTTYGSGIFHFGNINLDFVNHIEVYNANPSFEHSTEPAKFLIKLYSKDAERDSGLKLSTTLGSRGYTYNNLQYAIQGEEFSYFGYLAALDDNRKVYKSFEVPMRRDQEQYFFFNKIKGKNQQFQLQALKNNKHTFMGLGGDGRSDQASSDIEYLHIGYDNEVIENLKLSAVYEKEKFDNRYLHHNTSLFFLNNDEMMTLSAQYHYQELKNHDILIGGKYRRKDFMVSNLTYNGFPLPSYEFNKQEIRSFYIEDQYSYTPNWLFSLGLQAGKVKNNSNIKDQDMTIGRLGMIHTNENWTFKTFAHHSSLPIEPHFYVNTLERTKQESIKPTKLYSISQEIIYDNDEHTTSFLVAHNELKNPLKVSKSRLENKPKDELEYYVSSSYRYRPNPQEDYLVDISFKHYDNAFTSILDENYEEYKVSFQALNRYKKFDISNQLIYNHTTLFSGHFWNYTAGIKYHYSDSLTFSIKGENILNKARADYFERGQRNLVTTEWIYLEPLYISPIDQSLFFKMEYFF